MRPYSCPLLTLIQLLGIEIHLHGLDCGVLVHYDDDACPYIRSHLPLMAIAFIWRVVAGEWRYE